MTQAQFDLPTGASLLLFVCAFVAAVVVVARKPPQWLLRFREWRRTASSLQDTGTQVLFELLAGAVFFALFVGLARVGVPGLGLFANAKGFLISLLVFVAFKYAFKPLVEPKPVVIEDWLDWGLTDSTQRKSDPPLSS